MVGMDDDYLKETIGYISYYHYTKSDIINKIIGEKIDFMFTRSKDFLDKNEGSHILEPYIHALGSLYNKNLINKSFYDLLRKINNKRLNQNAKNKWILCFSRDGCSKYMKEKYAPNDGKIININPEPFEILSTYSDVNKLYVNIYDIDYSYKQMKKHLEKKIKYIYECYKKDVENSEVTITKLNKQVKEIMEMDLSILQFFYKSEIYKEEKEIRVLCEVHDEFEEEITKDSDDEIKLCFKTINRKRNLHIEFDKKYLLSIEDYTS